ncbi:MAG: copper resistance protein NlpE [Ginsengibacter sp.]
MHNRIFTFLIAFLVLIQLSCGNNSNKVSTKTENKAGKTDSSKVFSGIYFGVTPCADCPGIETTVHFNADSVFIENLVYMEKDASFADTGKWSISGKIITVSFPGHQSYFKIKSDSTVSILDAEKKEIKGALSDKFILHRKK